MQKLLAAVLLLLLALVNGYGGGNKCGWLSPRSSVSPRHMSPVTQKRNPGATEVTVCDPDYKVAIGFWAAAAASAAVLNPFAAVPLGAVAALLTRNTPRVRFSFDKDAMEVFIKNKDGSFGSRENFAVGGRNRWDYKSFVKWSFIPSRSLPIFVYFTENQTPGADPIKGQFHLFPVIMNSDQLNENLMKYVGPK